MDSIHNTIGYPDSLRLYKAPVHASSQHEGEVSV